MLKISRDNTPFSLLLSLILLIGLFTAEQIRILVDFATKYTNEDQTLLWYSAKEFIHGRLHEPNFFGQTYNTIFESVPGALIHTIFVVPFNWSVPISTMILVSILWLLLAFLAFRHGKYNLSLFALALPVIMRIQYIYLLDAPRGVMSGDLLATIAVVCALSVHKNNYLKIVFCIAFGGLAILWDYATSLIVIPVLIYIVYENQADLLKNLSKSLSYIAVSVLLPLGWLITDKLWYAKHPYEITATDVSSKPHWSIFAHSIAHISAYFVYLSPAIAPKAFVAIIILVILSLGTITISILRKSYGLLLSILSLVLLVGLALSIGRATNSLPDLYLSLARLLLTLPIAVWFVLFLVNIDGYNHVATRKLSKLKPRIAKTGLTILILIITIACFLTTEIKFKPIISNALSFDSQYFLVNTSSLNQSCNVLNQVYLSSNAQLFATNNRNLAYGCAAEFDNMNTLEPIYDRRGWIIKDSYQISASRMLVTGSSCSLSLPKYTNCTLEPNDTILLKFKPTPPAKILNTIGLHVKDYTPASD